MGLVLAFALRNWKLLAGAGIASLLCLVLVLHVHHGHKVTAELEQARADNALWAQAYRDERRAVGLQNDAIGKMAVRAADWQRAAQAATAEAHTSNLKAQASAAEFMRFKPKGATVCERFKDVAAHIREDAGR